MTTNITREELEAWVKYEIGKPCKFHPDHKMKKGKFGNWCGAKDEFGVWCSGGMPTEEFLTNLRKGQ